MPIGAALGRVAAPGSTGFDVIRLELADDLIAANAAGRLDQLRWEAAFHQAARRLADEVATQLTTSLTAAAEYANYPTRRLRTLLPDAEARESLYQRILAAAIPLEELAPLSDDDPAANRQRAAALESAWDGAARVAADEARRGRGLVDAVARWRRPTRGVWVATAVLIGVTIVVALWLGGQLPAPEWFDPVGRWWWSVPWP